MLASLKVLVSVSLLALVTEACEDPFFRSDLSHIVLWHRVLMFVVGVADTAAFGQLIQTTPQILSRWIALYSICFFIIAVSTRYLLR